LIPKKIHRRARYKNSYSKEALARGIKICRLCHRGIHKQYDEMTLAKAFDSLEAILQDEALARHFEWVRKQREA